MGWLRSEYLPTIQNGYREVETRSLDSRVSSVEAIRAGSERRRMEGTHKRRPLGGQ